METMILFIIFMFVIFLVILLSRFILDKAIFPFIEYLSNSSFEKYNEIVKKSKKRLIIHNVILKISECFFILLLIFFITVCLSLSLSPNDIILTIKYIIVSAFFICCTIFIGNFTQKIKDEFKRGKIKYDSLIEKTIHKIISTIDIDSYLYSRLKVIGKASMSFLIHCLLIYLILLFLTKVDNIPYEVFYLGLMFLPLALASWVYFSSLNNEEQNIRRIVIYVVLLIVTLGKSFFDFKVVIGLDVVNSANEYIIFLILTVFTAVDRLLKSIFDDLKSFKEQKKEKSKKRKTNRRKKLKQKIPLKSKAAKPRKRTKIKGRTI
ncbi:MULTISPECIES: hypothetical protein [Bacillus]|uniref:Uncharacterized protein n=1 Tax=Bacillus sonorensis TaxID=119858 RepID=A0ABN5AM87_9BACI|nr:hypothetical protein [Bacillus sonorensis]ASB91412.1 hypothetical protein S101395_04929 [Bacillus sonorensis]MBG9914722.1 membrane protein [Bacillus sonorensis]MCF7615979.1 hypothetical protein [Bacillus sonorensis]MCY8024001.1 hypothetical protein [Bacillus sonorensis]MCY8033171.1 hypothetical protein [Bacillus sonorensis]